MNRREFTKTLGLTGVAIGLNKSFLSRSSVAPAPQFAVTMDDFGWHNAVHLTAEDRNPAILDVFTDDEQGGFSSIGAEHVQSCPGAVFTRHVHRVVPAKV